MATMGIDLVSGIHAEIAEGDFTMLSSTSVTLDPLTKSYSTEGLVDYDLRVIYSDGTLENIKLLNNGKNSRLSAQGAGTMFVELEVRDTIGRTATHIIVIIVE